MGVIWFILWSDIWHNKSRTAQVVVIIALGTFAIGMIIGGSMAINPASMTSGWPLPRQ